MPAVPTTDLIPNPLSGGYDLRINNTLWQLAPSPTDPADVQPVDESGQVLRTQDNPEDFGVASDERSFSRESFAGGEGLARAHRREGTENDYTRFWSSLGLEIEPTTPGHPEVVTLAPRLDTLASIAGATNPQLAVIDSSLFVADPSLATVRRYDAPTTPGSAFTAEVVDAAATSITALTRIGRELYVSSVGQGIYRRTSAGTWGVYQAGIQSDRLWAAKLRLLGRSSTNPHQLYEINGTAATLLISLPAGSTWNDVTDAGEFILAAASDGYIYSIGEEAGALVLVAQTEVEGEEPVAVREVQGVVGITTRQRTVAGGYIGRLWTASLTGPRVTDGAVIRSWGDDDDADDWTPYPLIADRDSLVTWNRDSAWHYHLERAGLHSWVAASTPAVATDAATVSGKYVAAVIYEGATDPAILVQSDEVVTSGYVITPAADFFSSRLKDWVGLALFHAPLTSSVERIRVYYSTDPDAITDPNHSSWVLEFTRTGPSNRVDSEVPLTVRSRWLALKIVLETTAPSPSPILYGFAVRATVVTPDVVINLPVNVSDWVDSPWRQRRRVPGLGRVRQSTLFGFRSSSVEVELYRRSLVFRGTVKTIGTPEVVTTPGGSPTLRATLQVKGRLAPGSGGGYGSGETTGDTWGVPQYGPTTYGG